MDWLLDNIQIVVLLVIAFGSWLKTRIDRKLEDQEDEGEPDPTVWGDEGDNGWEPPAAPPPLPERKAETVFQPTPPPMPAAIEVSNVSAVLEEQKKIEEEFHRVRRARQTSPKPAARSTKPGNPPGTPPSRLSSVLRDRSSVRRAVVLKEILGRPVGMR